jgi:glycosyltransferase involved in cell wall biosynthesis
MIQPGVSIIICCHNGASRLDETVRHIAQQEVPVGIPWEFILIDNACSDNSVEVATNSWNTYNGESNFRVVAECKLGLSYARCKGFESAQYDYIILCDDDNWLSKDYVAHTYSIMRTKSFVAALGGCGKLIFEISPPPWIEFTNIFASGEQNPWPGKVLTNKLYGAGCVIRKSAYNKLKELGFKSMLSDRRGAQLSSGGDHELCYALAIMGYEIWYDPRLQFLHYITRERLTWDYFMRYAKESSMCFDVLTSYKMIASELTAHSFSHFVWFRDLVYCFRKFIGINIRRCATDSNSVHGMLLYFRHMILRGKLLAYFEKHKAMMQNHREILKFKEACVQARGTRQHVGLPLWRLIFSLRLFRQH